MGGWVCLRIARGKGGPHRAAAGGDEEGELRVGLKGRDDKRQAALLQHVDELTRHPGSRTHALGERTACLLVPALLQQGDAPSARTRAVVRPGACLLHGERRPVKDEVWADAALHQSVNHLERIAQKGVCLDPCLQLQRTRECTTVQP